MFTSVVCSAGTRVLVLTAMFLPAACGGRDPVSVSLSDNTSQRLAVAAGTEFSITLGTVGPGEYASPPVVSAPAVAYVDVAEVEPNVPAGPRQRFRFRATARGQAIIVFHHTGTNPAVEDTVQVN